MGNNDCITAQGNGHTAGITLEHDELARLAALYVGIKVLASSYRSVQLAAPQYPISSRGSADDPITQPLRKDVRDGFHVQRREPYRIEHDADLFERFYHIGEVRQMPTF
nr:hypothetical protein [Paraburkholderia sp. J41]